MRAKRVNLKQQVKPDISYAVAVVCRQLINEHKELALFKTGFGKIQKCNCTGCRMARIILGE